MASQDNSEGHDRSRGSISTSQSKGELKERSKGNWDWELDPELRRVTDLCIKSNQNHSFVVGPPRCGKSTRLPILMAEASRKRVISVQPDANIAKLHAEYTSLGVVILDEVHVRTLVQELCYAGIDNVLGGHKPLPPGWSKDTKFVFTTAYAQAEPFADLFGYTEEEVHSRTFHIAASQNGDQENEVSELFLEEDDTTWLQDFDTHRGIRDRISSILHDNGEANVLAILMGGSYFGGNIVKETNFGENTKVFDLSECDVQEVDARGRGGCVIMTTLDYASRIPLDGITDVVCPHSKVQLNWDENLCKNVTTTILLCRWELEFAKSHLDPKCKSGTIHYVFPEAQNESVPENVPPHFLFTDRTEFMLGLIRLGVLDSFFARQIHHRFPPTMLELQRALYELEGGLSLLVVDEHHISAKVVDNRSKIIWALMDGTWLDFRAAVCLGDLAHRITTFTGEPEESEAVLLLGILLAVFRNRPFLRRREARRPAPLADLDLEDLCLGEKLTSDAWINAAYWLRHVVKSETEGFDTLPSLADSNWVVERGGFVTALAKVRSLANHLELPARCLAKVMDGSFLKYTQDLVYNQASIFDWIRYNPLTAYLQTYKRNLTYFKALDDTEDIYIGTDISSKREIRLDKSFLGVDLEAELRQAKAQGYAGIYGCVSDYVETDNRVIAHGLTLFPEEVIKDLMEQNGGATDLWELLKLK
ncbi:hypothetical protein F5Y05DRAFT_420050 [Hypoxylon sp. FL0543]|nr:hypothetical protein F5Y05DRAFT_420050 [Hypoxylon sp. FL0543]